MTNDQYRAVSRISNSDLSTLERSLFGKPKTALPQNAFDFGTAIHEAILEPHLNSPKLVGVDYQLVEKLTNEALNHPLLSWVLSNSKKEEIVLWERYGLPLKSKLDIIWNQNAEVWDLKTTSCSSLKAFQQTCLEYDYYRQAAFYLDSIEAKNFTFVAISKTAKKNPIFIFQMDNAMIADGRKRYEKMLKYWKNQNLKLPNT